MLIKAADGHQSDIIELERLLDRPGVPQATRRRIEAEIRQVQAGEKGERDAAYIIDLYFGRSPNWAIIHDLRIKVDGLTAQIDHVIINRLAQVFVCESKHFAEGVSVNDHGEWSRWWHGKQDDIPSPIEQNRRHILLLERAFDDGIVKAPKRLGLVRWKPQFRGLVLVSDNARIGRPRRKVEGVNDVFKAEQLKTRLFDAFDRTSDLALFGAIGKEGLRTFARELVALHQPPEFNWAAKFGLARTNPSSHSVASITNDRIPSIPTREFPAWSEVLDRYRQPARLHTVVHRAPFVVQAAGHDLRVTPESSGRGRTLTMADYERAAPLLDGAGRGVVNQASRNSSYVQAILEDVRRQPR